MKYKAVLFDFDGVFVNSEIVWTKFDSKFLISLFGEQRYFELKNSLVGLSISNIYSLLIREGVEISKEEFYTQYRLLEKSVYLESPLNMNMPSIVEKLSNLNVKIGIVSNSPSYIIRPTIGKLNIEMYINSLVTTDLDDSLEPKPAPDYYLKGCELLNVAPSESVAVEDSQNGVLAAKSAGLTVICLKEFHHEGYNVEGADYYVDDTTELAKLLLNNE